MFFKPSLLSQDLLLLCLATQLNVVNVSSLLPTSRDGGLRNKTGVTSDNQKHTVEKVSTQVEKTYSSAMAFQRKLKRHLSAMAFQLKLKRHIRLAAFLSIGPFHDLIR